MTRRSPAKSGASADLLAGGVAAKGTPSALAVVYLTRTTRGGLSVVLLVECPFDRGHLHLHRAPLDFESGKRKAGCGAGRYVVRVGALEAGAA